MKKRLANDPGYFLNLLLSCVGLPWFFSLLDKKKQKNKVFDNNYSSAFPEIVSKKT